MLNVKDLEKKILLNLLEQGQRPIIKIAKDLGVTRQTVAKKIEQMHNSGIIISFFPKILSKKPIIKKYDRKHLNL